MTHTAFFDLARQTAHAALNGSQQPALGGKLLTHLKIIAKCFSGDEVVTVDEDTAEFLILAKTSASGAASLIDTTAVLNTSDPDEPQYEFEWNPADSIQLRAVLDAAADPTVPVELRYEFRFERGGNKGCIGGPIWLLNNFFRPETSAPLATADSTWELLKATIQPGTHMTRSVNDTTKVMTLNVSAGADGEDGREIELQAGMTHIQWRLVGAPTWTNLIALATLTGAAGTNGSNGTNGTNGSAGADGDDGREIEIQVTGTHIQWRLVGAPTWTNLIALATLTGAAGTNGSNGTNGTNGSAGADGDDGREIELQTTDTHVQWRYVGAGSWTNLAALSVITGPAGADGNNGGDGSSAYLVAVANGFMGIETVWLASLVGADGEDGEDGASTPGGSNQQVQANHDGALAGTAVTAWDPANGENAFGGDFNFGEWSLGPTGGFQRKVDSTWQPAVGTGAQQIVALDSTGKLPAVDGSQLTGVLSENSMHDYVDAAEAAMTAASSANSNSVSLLGMTVSDPPTQGEVQSIVTAFDALVAALRR